MPASQHVVPPDSKIRLSDIDPGDTSGFDGRKPDGEATLRDLNGELEKLQELLYVDGRHRLLIVLQGMDTSGKDGAIRHVFEGVNPQGVQVANFKAPTAEELSHDFLWRVHKHTPGRGQMVIFNRSHYEDVLVVRVRGLAPEPVWRARFDAINEFERLLVNEGTTILKFFLHISKAEQKERLQARLDDPAKHWKFNPGDLAERERWDAYQEAYQDVLRKTSTEYAPWRVIPANKKWYRDLAIARVIVGTLRDLNLRPPPADFDPAKVRIAD